MTIREVSLNKTLTMKYLENIVIMEVTLPTFIFGFISLAINMFEYPKQWNINRLGKL